MPFSRMYRKVGPLGGGSWVQVTDSKIRVLIPGAQSKDNYWLAPNTVKVKVGALGGGTWETLTYAGMPNTPASIGVGDWDNTFFGWVKIGFNAPVGGAHIAKYNVTMSNSAGSPIHTKVVNGAPDYVTFYSNDTYSDGTAVGHPRADGAYIFSVVAIAASGATSTPRGGLKVLMGHPEVTEPVPAYDVRSDWSSPVQSGSRYRGQPFGFVVPGNVVLKAIHWQQLRTPDGNPVSPWEWPNWPGGAWGPDGWRYINWWWPIDHPGGRWSGDSGAMIHNSITTGPGGNTTGTWKNGNGAIVSSATNSAYVFNNWGEGREWGIVPGGYGYSPGPDATYMLYADAVWGSGDLYTTIPATTRVVTAKKDNSQGPNVL
jgi:hypothetical protein